MTTINKVKNSPFGFMTRGMKILAAILLALTLSVAGMLAGAASSADSAYAAIYAAEDSAQSQKASDDNAKAAPATEAEQIEDDETPMSSGLDSAMTSTSSTAGVPLYAIVGVGIVAVGVFFALGTGRVNASISKMKNSIK